MYSGFSMKYPLRNLFQSPWIIAIADTGRQGYVFVLLYSPPLVMETASGILVKDLGSA